MERNRDPLGLLDPSGADGATGGTASGSGIDRSLPDVALSAAPPDLFIAAQGHIPGGKAFVQRLVPLLGQLGPEGCQIIEPGQDFFAGAVGAAAALFLGSGKRGRLPAVALLAKPPDLLVSPGQSLLRFSRILLPIPLFGQVGVKGLQIGFSGQDRFPGAIGTAAAIHHTVHRRFPAMALLAAPPDLPMAPGGQFLSPRLRIQPGIRMIQQILMQRHTAPPSQNIILIM